MLGEYARMAMAALARAPGGWRTFRLIDTTYGRAAIRELEKAGLVRLTGRGRNRKVHLEPRGTR